MTFTRSLPSSCHKGWSPVRSPRSMHDLARRQPPGLQLLSNGRYTVMLTGSGAGYSHWGNCAITRWHADPTRDDHGCWLYLRDLDDGTAWSTGLQPVGGAPDEYGVGFEPGRARIRRRDGDIEAITEVLVAGDGDAEVRRVSLHNHGDRERRIEVTSYAELVLAPQSSDSAHPAFSKMFVRTEWLSERRCLVGTRRVRSPGDPSACAVQWLDVEGGGGDEPQRETDRARFIGRGHDQRDPVALAGRLSGTVGTVLDPIFSLRRRVRIAPGATVVLRLWTVAGGTRRVRAPGDASACAVQWPAVEGGGGDSPQRATARARFIGRGHYPRDPVAWGGELSGTVGTVRDPIFSLRRRVRIAPGATVVLQLWTVAAGTREEALALADRFRDAGAFASASESALQRSQETLAGLGIDAAQAQRLQRLAGALLYSDPTLRATSGDLAKGQGGPPTLWAGGVSGDRPIALLRIDDDAGLDRVV